MLFGQDKTNLTPMESNFPIVVLNEQRGFQVQTSTKWETKTRMPQSLFSKHWQTE
jgi:hypothetical protein